MANKAAVNSTEVKTMRCSVVANLQITIHAIDCLWVKKG